MTITAETLAAALREALPRLTIKRSATGGIEITNRKGDLVAYLWGHDGRWVFDQALFTRADRDLARAVFTVIDRLEDRDGA